MPPVWTSYLAEAVALLAVFVCFYRDGRDHWGAGRILSGIMAFHACINPVINTDLMHIHVLVRSESFLCPESFLPLPRHHALFSAFSLCCAHSFIHEFLQVHLCFSASWLLVIFSLLSTFFIFVASIDLFQILIKPVVGAPSSKAPTSDSPAPPIVL